MADGHARARAISLYAAAGGLSASIGLVVGGIVADLISWRAGFLINVPIGILLIICALRFIPETARHRGKFDVGGAVLSALGMTGLVYATISSVSNGWLSITTMLTFAASIILLWVFVLVEKHAQQPIMPLRLFHSSMRSGAYLARILYIGAAMGFFFFSTQFMQGVLHYSAIQAGLAFLPAMLINFLVALQVPRLTGRFGSQNLLLISLLAVLLGMALLSRLDAQSHYLSGLLLPLILMGFGIGGATGPLTAMGLSGVAASDAGAASGLINAAHQMGGALGLSIMVATAVAGSSHLEGISLMLHQNHLAFLAGTGLVALSVVIVLGLIKRK
ncbi:MFS transporter [Pantoea phytobeneficialis]|uniref:MFS transporter n=1 Tax=Pantoea phytobeneficialis TaxID=2052056 RepID=A0ABT8XVB1_9GAMM|nr:MFS transporter [Pantoea phytobeneficialis]MDO6406849.1 MFS transporter [Pantoea phytobeneficialis]